MERIEDIFWTRWQSENKMHINHRPLVLVCSKWALLKAALVSPTLLPSHSMGHWQPHCGHWNYLAFLGGGAKMPSEPSAPPAQSLGIKTRKEAQLWELEEVQNHLGTFSFKAIRGAPIWAERGLFVPWPESPGKKSLNHVVKVNWKRLYCSDFY